MRRRGHDRALPGAGDRRRRDDQQIRGLGLLKRLGRHEESGPGPHLRGGTDHGHVPGRRLGDLLAQRVGVVQHVEDGREPGVEHPVVDDDRYLSGQQARHDQGAGDESGDPGDVPDPRERAGGQRANAQRRGEPRHAHDHRPDGERAVAQPGGSGKRRHGRSEPGGRPPARHGPLHCPPGPVVRPASHRGAAEVRELVTPDDRGDEGDGNGKRWPARPDQRASQQRHRPAGQQHRRYRDDLYDDGHAQHADRGGSGQRAQRGRQDGRCPQDWHHADTVATTRSVLAASALLLRSRWPAAWSCWSRRPRPTPPWSRSILTFGEDLLEVVVSWQDLYLSVAP